MTLRHTATGSGPAVLLLHGLGGDRRQALGLLPDDFPATRIAPDLPGHGETDLLPNEPITFAAFAAEVAKLLDRRPAEPVDRPVSKPLVPPIAEPLDQPAAQPQNPPSAHPPGRPNVEPIKQPTAALLDPPTAKKADPPVAERPVSVVGVSMGAGVALALASVRPDLVRRLVLVRPSWLLDTSPPHLEPFRTIARILTTRGIDPDAFRATEIFRRIDREGPAMAQSLLGQFRRPFAVERARVLAEMPVSLPLGDAEAYRKLGLDVTIVAAPQDPVHPEGLAREMQRLIRDARLVMVPRKMPDPVEHQTAVQRAVVDALEH
jgi:pimeloyl-ACP methyl ester carboxylesterase